jgi:parallel beta-helix repeat protein
MTLVEDGALLSANATENGDGGRVIVWADKITKFAGDILAKAGINGGNGGFVETSGKDILDVTDTASVDASAVNGEAGTWLLDPLNIVIADADQKRIVQASQNGDEVFSPEEDTDFDLQYFQTFFGPIANPFSGKFNSWLDKTTLLNALEGGSNVEVTTQPSITGRGDGDIAQITDLSWTTDASLTLNSQDDIYLGKNITTDGGNINLFANDDIHVGVDFDGNWVGNLLTLFGQSSEFASEVRTTGGDFAVDGQSFTVSENSLIDTTGSAGNVMINTGSFDLQGTINVGTDQTSSSQNISKIFIDHQDGAPGSIGIGNANGDMEIDQDELNNMTASELVIGSTDWIGGSSIAPTSNTTAIDVEDADTTANTIDRFVRLRADAGSGSEDIYLYGTNTFNGLIAYAEGDVQVGDHGAGQESFTTIEKLGAFLQAGDDVRLNTGSTLDVIGSQGEGQVEFQAGLGQMQGGSHTVEIEGGLTNGNDENPPREFEGDVRLISAGDVEISATGSVHTNGGRFTVNAPITDISGTVDTTGSVGDVDITTDDLALSGTLDATGGAVDVTRLTQGDVYLGDGSQNSNRLHISQSELDNILADTFQISDVEFGPNNSSVEDIRVKNANFNFADVVLSTKFKTLKNDHVLFVGDNEFTGTLTAKAEDNIVVKNGLTLVDGDVDFFANTNDGGLGNVEIGKNATLETTNGNILLDTTETINGDILNQSDRIIVKGTVRTNGGDFTSNGGIFDAGYTGAKIFADAGKITINNIGLWRAADDVFNTSYSYGANSGLGGRSVGLKLLADDLEMEQGFRSLDEAVDSIGDVTNFTEITAGLQGGGATLEEQVTSIDKDVILLGQGPANTTIQSPVNLANNFGVSPQNKGIVYAEGGEIVLDNFTIDGLGRGNSNYRFAGVLLRNASGQISNNVITGVRRTPLSGTQDGTGIYAFTENSEDQNTLDITGNDINDFQKNAMALIGNQIGTVSGNLITGSGQLGNGLPAQNGIQVTDGAFDITNNNLSNFGYTPRTWAASGILLSNAEGSTATGNEFTDFDNAVSIYVSDADNVSIDDNKINDSWFGLIGLNSDQLSLTNNDFDGNEIGLYLGDSSNVTLDDNDILNSMNVGLIVAGTTNFTSFAGNIFNGTPIYIQHTGSNDIDARGNTFRFDVNNDGDYDDSVDYDFDPGNGTLPGDLDKFFAMEDKIDHKLDDLSYGRVITQANNWFATQDSGSIQRGIDTADAGDTVWVDDGTFNEQVTINKNGLSLIGDGTTNTTTIAGSGSGAGLTLAASDLLIDGFKIQNFEDGIYTNADIDDIELTDILTQQNTRDGFRLDQNADLSGLELRAFRANFNTGTGLNILGTIGDTGGVKGDGLFIGPASVDGSTKNSTFNDNKIGIGASFAGNVDDGTRLSEVAVTNAIVNNNTNEGIYLEKISNAQFKGLIIDNSGTNATTNPGAAAEGFEIALKYGQTANDIDLLDSTIVNAGFDATNGRGNGISITTRDGSVLDDVFVKNINITPIQAFGLAFGTDFWVTGSTSSITNVTVDNVTVKNPTMPSGVSDKTGILAYGGIDGITIENSDVTGGGFDAAIALTDGVNDAILTNNTLTGDADGAGYFLRNVSLVGISGGNNADLSDFDSGIYVDGQIDDLTISNLTADYNENGMRVASSGSIDGLTIKDSHFDDNTYGFNATGVDATTTITDVFVKDSSFDRNDRKGFYAEKMNDAEFINVSANDSGLNPGNGNFGTGFELNLKGADYSNILIDGLTVQNSGANSDNRGTAVSIVGYGGLPDSWKGGSVLTGTVSDVTIQNSTIEAAGTAGLGIGGSVDDVTIFRNSITGPEALVMYEIDGSQFNAGNPVGIKIKQNKPFRNGGIFSEGTPFDSDVGQYAIGADNVQTPLDIKNNHITGTKGGHDQLFNGVIIVDSDQTKVHFNKVFGFADQTGRDTYTALSFNGEDKEQWVTGAGIYFQDSENGLIRGNNVYDNTDGIRIVDSANATVQRNTVYDHAGNNGRGIVVKRSHDTTVGGYFDKGSGNVWANTLTNNYQGIRVHDSNNVTVHYNTVNSSLKEAIHFSRNSDNGLIDQNTVNGGTHGIRIDRSDLITITDNQVSDVNWGIFADNGSDDLIIGSTSDATKGNTVENTTQDGIFAESGDRVTVGYNVLNNIGQDGIDINNSAGPINVVWNDLNSVDDNGVEITNTTGMVTVANNDIDADNDGVFGQNFDQMDVLANVIGGNAQNGVVLNDGSTANVNGNTIGTAGDGVVNGILISNISVSANLSGNTIFGNTNDGIRITGSNNPVVSGNTITNFKRGIHFKNTTGNDQEISGNTINDTKRRGINVVKANGDIDILGNTINNFKKRGIVVFKSPATSLIDGNTLVGNNGGNKAVENGIEVGRSGTTEIYSNTLSDLRPSNPNTKYVTTGIYVWNSGDNSIIGAENQGNTINGSVPSGNSNLRMNGIWMDNGDGNSIAFNEVSDVSTGIVVRGTDGERASNYDITNNTLTNVREGGIWGISADNGYIADNLLNNVGYGINLYDAGSTGTMFGTSELSSIPDINQTPNLIVFNDINQTTQGVTIQQSSGLIIVAFNEIEASETGVFADGFEDLGIVLNNIQGNGLGNFGGGSIISLSSFNGDNGNGYEDYEDDYYYEPGGNIEPLETGIDIANGDRALILGNLIGSEDYGFSNGDLISYGVENGIKITDVTQSWTIGNAIFGNSDIGIDVNNSNITDEEQIVYIGDGSIVFGDEEPVEEQPYPGEGDDFQTAEIQLDPEPDFGPGYNLENDNGFGYNPIIGGPGLGGPLFDPLGGNLVNQFDIGIRVQNADNVTVENNTLSNVETGIQTNTVNNLTITGNEITANSLIGIELLNTTGGLVNGNLVDGFPIGISVRDDSDDIEISENDIENYNNIGIEIAKSNDIRVIDQLLDGEFVDGETSGNANTGVQVVNSTDILLNNVTSDNHAIAGLDAIGGSNGRIELVDSSFTGNTNGARFQSGQIDFTGGGNSFTDGTNGLVFDPDLTDTETTPSLSIVGNTLNDTVFTGQTGFYVALFNGALFNPGTPTIIDAENVTFDGIVGDGTTPLDYFTVEAKLRDFDDFATLGQIFIGPEPDVDEEDVLQDQALINAFGPGGGLVTVLGLPFAPDAAGNIPAEVLAGLNPAAGGDLTAEELNALDTAAGTTKASCWTQATGTFGFAGSVGARVNYDLNNAPEAILADAEVCGGQI